MRELLELVWFLMSAHFWNNFEIQRFYRYLSKKKITKKMSRMVGIEWILMSWVGSYVQNNEATYFDSFSFEHKRDWEFFNNKYIKSSFVRIQLDSSLMCGYICIRSIDFMLNNKSWRTLLGYFYQKIKKQDQEISIKNIWN